MENDWKLLTVLIGANDICLGQWHKHIILYVPSNCAYRCSGHIPYLTADNYEKHMTELMEEIHSNIPKVFVNYILLLNVSQVHLS